MTRLLSILITLVVAASVAAADRDKINKAIERGSNYLKARHQNDGTWGDRGHDPLGVTALAALALIESKTPLADPAITKALRFVRSTAPQSNHTYSVSLSILLLDRVGNRDDSALIRRLGERIANGQCSNGAWTYQVPVTSGSYEPLRQLVNAVGLGDNSNTQFAVLGLWVSRRHSAQVDEALKRAADYFRQTVSKSGRGSGWSYVPVRGGQTPSMTCAGLIALATQHGMTSLRAERKEKSATGLGTKGPAKIGRDEERGAGSPALDDPLVQGGLIYLENHLGFGKDHDWYFHWSLERVAVIFDLPKIGRVDWYEWSSDIAVASQRHDGSWEHQWGTIPETSFVLLVLNRSNVAGDLTRLVGSGQSLLSAGSDMADLQRRTEAASKSNVANKANALLEELASAKPTRQRQIIKELRDNKGTEYSNLLLEAVGQLSGDMQDEARQALVERFTRLTAKSLRDKLTAGSDEAQNAAILAIARKMSHELVPDLIELLTNDKVSRTAAQSLQSLTGQDLGPGENASFAERFAAQKRWRKWHEGSKSK